MREPNTPHLYEFGICGRVPGSQNQLVLSLETPGHLKKVPGIFQTYFYKSQNVEFQKKCRFGQGWAPKNDEGPLNTISKILDMGSISSRKHEIEMW